MHLGAIYWCIDREIDGKKIKLNLWDTAGQEKYHSLIPMYTRSVDVILLTFDLTNKKSFYNLEKWYNLCKHNFNFKIIIIGNKKDNEHLIQVNENMIKEFINQNLENNIPYILTSANTGENISELFDIIFKLSNEIVI